MPSRFGCEVFHEKYYAHAPNHGNQNDKCTPRTCRGINIGVVEDGKLAKEKQIVNKADQSAKKEGPEPRYHADNDGNQ
jgi:hypothetical protein